MSSFFLHSSEKYSWIKIRFIGSGLRRILYRRVYCVASFFQPNSEDFILHERIATNRFGTNNPFITAHFVVFQFGPILYGWGPNINESCEVNF